MVGKKGKNYDVTMPLWSVTHQEIINITEYQGTQILIIPIRADIKADTEGSGPQSNW